MPAAAPDESGGIVWVGKFLPTYPMFWRCILAGWAIAAIPVALPFAILGLWLAAVAIIGVTGVIFGASYLLAIWLSHRPRGGLECLFAVTPEGARYHAGDELRHYGEPLAQSAAAATGNLQHLLLLKGSVNCNDVFMPWEEARSIEVLPTMRLVCVSRGLFGPVPLFCEAANFEAVCQYALAHAPHARVRGRLPTGVSSRQAAHA